MGIVSRLGNRLRKSEADNVGSDALMAGWVVCSLGNLPNMAHGKCRAGTNVDDGLERCLRKGKGMDAVLVRRQPVGKLAGPPLAGYVKSLFVLHCWENPIVHSRRQNPK